MARTGHAVQTCVCVCVCVCMCVCVCVQTCYVTHTTHECPLSDVTYTGYETLLRYVCLSAHIVRHMSTCTA